MDLLHLNWNDIVNNANLSNPYVVHTLYALASLLLGMLGMVIGERNQTNHRVGLMLGLCIGIGTMVLFATPYGYLAPGWCLVFVIGYLGHRELTKIAGGGKTDPQKAPPGK